MEIDLPAKEAASAPTDRELGALIALLAFPWGVHASVVGASMFGVPVFFGRAYAWGILAFAALIAVGAWRLASGSLPSTPAAVSRDGDAQSDGVLRPIRLMKAAAVLCLTSAFAAGVLLPVVAYDMLSYRLPTIAAWFDAGQVAWLAGDDPVRNGYPMGHEAVAACFIIAVGSFRWACIPSVFFVVAGVVAVFRAIRAAGVRRPFAELGAAAFAMVPATLLNAPTGYVDAAFAAAAVTLFVLVAELASSTTKGWVVIATGLVTSHVLCLKGTGLPLVALAFAGAAALRVARKERPFTGYAMIAVLALPGAFWFARNILHEGNPLWPIQFGLAGHTLLPGTGTVSQILDAPHNTPRELRSVGEGTRIALAWLQWAGTATTYDDRLAGLGFTWPFAVLATTLLAFRKVRQTLGETATTAWVFVVILTAIAFTMQPMRWWSRYTLWVWGAGALSLGFAAEYLARRNRDRLLPVAVSAVALIAVLEGTHAALYANGLSEAVSRVGFSRAAADYDLRGAPNAVWWVDPDFWRHDFDRQPLVCRGKRNLLSLNYVIDGVLAQVTPRPRIFVLDDQQGWRSVKAAWRRAGCLHLLLFTGSPALPDAQSDPDVTVERALGAHVVGSASKREDPFYVVHEEGTRLGAR